MNFEDFNYESYNKYILIDPNKIPDPVQKLQQQNSIKDTIEDNLENDEDREPSMVGFSLP